MSKRIILLTLLFLIVPIRVYAIEGNTTLTCDKGTTEKALPGTRITCNLTGTISSGFLISYNGKIQLGSDLTLVSITPAAATWSNSTPNELTMEYSAKEDITGNYEIATIIIEASNSVTTGVDTNIAVVDQQYTGFTGPDDSEGPDHFLPLANRVQNIRIASTNNYLSTITISAGSLSPEFNKNTTSYTVDVASNVTTATVSATPEASSSTVTGGGEKTLNYGTNEVTITVKSESNSTKEYKILINKQDNRSTESNLLDFGFYNYDIKFDKDTTNYTLKVDNNITKLGLCKEKPTLSDTLCINLNNSFTVDEKASLGEVEYNGTSVLARIEDGNNYIIGDIKEGENILNIAVSAENESSKTYRIAIVKGNSNKNNSSTTNTTGAKGTIENPKTGNTFVFIILAILIISITCVLYYYKKNQKANS